MRRLTFKLIDRTAQSLTIEDVRRRALRRLPRMLRDYVEGVAEDGETAKHNFRAFSDYRLVPRALTGVSMPDLGTSLGGEEIALPVLLAPTGLAGLLWPRGEIALARAAEAAGTKLILSTATTTPIGEVGAAMRPGHWFQLYPQGNAEWVGDLMLSAEASGFETLVLTVDAPTIGKREAEMRNGIGLPIRLTPDRCLDILMHPRWLAGFLRHRRLFPAHYPAAAPASLPISTPRNMQLDLRWEDVAWIRKRWPGRFYVKGLLRAEDARIAIDEIGADGVILSNHGGRQLGNTIAALDAVAEVARELNGRGKILLDGGIRRGSDVVKAICLGADAVLIGRPALYGLACQGQSGVEHVLEILRAEMQTTLTLLGCASVRDLSPDFLSVVKAHR
jgi:L-lactate dehydrogenase (cytochrome)/(S)-mandelate dehydrogenase